MSTELDSQFTEQVAAAFQEHMTGGGEAVLLRTSPLGQSTQGRQRNTLELLAVQQGALITMLLAQVSAEARQVAQQTAALRQANERVRASEERLRALQKRLIEKERLAAIGTTAAELTHEIRNPLHGMILATDLLEHQLRQRQEDGLVLSSVRALKNQTLRLAILLRKFSVLARPQCLTLQPTNLGELVHEVLAAELPLYTLRGIAVEQRVTPDLPLLHIDQDKLTQVVLNLCKNAVEAMPQGGTLTVLVHNSGNQVHVEITDTGEGIPADVDIFAPFVTTKNKGSGLGLPIVRQIVDAHGGTLTYTSAPGIGTTFVVALPLQREDV
jgi:signal transduction histidine kinase